MPNGPRILITRPAGQHLRLVEQCQALGLDTHHWPCLIIEPLLSPPVAASLRSVDGPVLFISSNAVHCAHRLRPMPWLKSPTYAIGAASASALKALLQPLAAEPMAPYNSESALALLQETHYRSLSIIKGVGGRSLIQDTLMREGWQVKTIDVYQRRRPTGHEADAAAVFASGGFDLISVGSDQILTNLVALSESQLDQLLDSQLVVNSNRCALLATQFGFNKQAMIADPAGDDGQLHCIKQWLDEHQKVS